MNLSGARSGRDWRVIFAATLLLCSSVLTSCFLVPVTAPEVTATPIPPDLGDIHVTVIGADGTELLTGVVVRVTDSIVADGDDHDDLKLSSCPSGRFIAAWAPGYQVSFVPCTEAKAYSILLQPLGQNIYDNPNYSWVSAYSSCSQCHASQLGPTYNEFREWEINGHATVFTDRFFESMYRGTDVYGVSGPLTQWVYRGEQLVRQINASAPEYKGPGLQLDYPGRAGNCAYCHAPTAISSSMSQTDLISLFQAQGDSRREGITCDLCHKVNNVIMDSHGYPFPDKPGVLSYKFLKMDGFTTGPFSNIVVPHQNFITSSRSTCVALFSSSDFCASCHYGKFGDTLIYNSYGEWRESSYAQNVNSSEYRTCQDCHMSRLLGDNNIPFSQRKACSETAEGFQDFDHNMMDYGRDEALGRDVPRLIRGAARVDANFDYKPERNNSLEVIVTVRNRNVGHKFPTDSPLRHLILVLEARDQFGNILLQTDGSQIPNWAGSNGLFVETPGVRAYAGLPGKIFANLLIEEDINLWPSAAYWNETKPAQVTKDGVVSDNRLAPGGRDDSNYFFAIPNDGEVRFTISLMYRFGFYDLMHQKRWVDDPRRWDVPVAVLECRGNANNAKKIDCQQIDPKP